MPTATNTSLRRPRTLALLTSLLGLVVVGLSLTQGEAGPLSVSQTLRGWGGLLGLGEGLERSPQALVQLRLARTLVALGVGASLGLSGALLQGVFRNDLASPAVLGVTSGASLGAALAILATGGYGPLAYLGGGHALAPFAVSSAAFLGAIIVLAAVTAIGTRNGSVSIPTLLLGGLAVNAVLGGALAAIQSFALRDFDLARALLSWTFGRIADHDPVEIVALFVALAIGAACIPWVARELDLFASGETDARVVGVAVGRIKVLSLGAAGILAGVAVSVVGQIAFVGLIVPHLVRLVVGRSHVYVLPFSLLGGGVFLVACDVLQRLIAHRVDLRTGVWMSLLGGPLFLVLLVRDKQRLDSW